MAGLQPGAEQTAVDALNERVTQFEAKYPDITIKTQEYNWLASTFAADLAGGTLPDVFEVPATDTKVLIQNGQIADIDAAGQGSCRTRTTSTRRSSRPA